MVDRGIVALSCNYVKNIGPDARRVLSWKSFVTTGDQEYDEWVYRALHVSSTPYMHRWGSNYVLRGLWAAWKLGLSLPCFRQVPGGEHVGD